MKTRLVLLLLAGGPLACLAVNSAVPADPAASWVDPADPAVTSIRRTGESTIDRVGTMLVFEVERALADKGVVKAVETLHLKNLELPKPVAGQPRVTAIKFTSLGLRNPANRPDAADSAALGKIETALRTGDEIPLVLVQRLEHPNAAPEWRVYRPITTMPQCLKCHGSADKLQPEVREALARFYPEDKAIDFTAYQWRGIIRVTLAAAEPAAPAKAKQP